MGGWVDLQVVWCVGGRTCADLVGGWVVELAAIWWVGGWVVELAAVWWVGGRTCRQFSEWVELRMVGG